MTNSLNSPIWGYGPRTWQFGMISLQKKVVDLGWQPSTINGRVLTHAYTCLHPDGHTDLCAQPIPKCNPDATFRGNQLIVLLNLTFLWHGEPHAKKS